MIAPTTQVPTLVIHDWFTRCSACGCNASPEEPQHNTSGFGRAGCGVTYQAVALGAEAAQLSERGARAYARELGLPYVGQGAS